ncbi:hypothetical protein [Agromyces sp. Leaf222]|uniref:hypothetical protein n=1 Tax=Agromyces sp. Leaf222 TaxID=1735688 RepID=UPI0006F37829|nr:hypothetical protein [Agromyces sp. Leaf222]KQM83894.1 hypothetical protein ASE68_12380 [Agromyces sp. Leaf222]
MTTTLLSPGSGVIAVLAVRSGLRITEWGLRRAARRADADRLRSEADTRAVVAAALPERDALIRPSVNPFR